MGIWFHILALILQCVAFELAAAVKEGTILGGKFRDSKFCIFLILWTSFFIVYELVMIFMHLL